MLGLVCGVQRVVLQRFLRSAQALVDSVLGALQRFGVGIDGLWVSEIRVDVFQSSWPRYTPSSATVAGDQPTWSHRVPR
jgi:hypothetical protein